MLPGQVERQEFEYIRHGTTTVIGNWDVVQGVTFQNTIGPTRTEADFVLHMQQTVSNDPDAKCEVGVRGGLPQHPPVGRLSGMDCERLRTGQPAGKKRECEEF